MTEVWEASVRATHGFVKPEDIDYFKQLVEKIDWSSFPVYCLVSENKVLGFIGVENHSIETLFLEPGSIGKGYGKKLMEFALDKLGANKVDVNEQNIRAVNFYSGFGFVPYGRTEKSPEGKDYPIIKMRLETGAEAE